MRKKLGDTKRLAQTSIARQGPTSGWTELSLILRHVLTCGSLLPKLQLLKENKNTLVTVVTDTVFHFIEVLH